MKTEALVALSDKVPLLRRAFHLSLPVRAAAAGSFVQDLSHTVLLEYPGCHKLISGKRCGMCPGWCQSPGLAFTLWIDVWEAAGASLYLYYASAGYQTNLIKQHLIQRTHAATVPGSLTIVSCHLAKGWHRASAWDMAEERETRGRNRGRVNEWKIEGAESGVREKTREDDRH